MKMTQKAKQYWAIGGGVVICIALVAAIGTRFGKPAVVEVNPAQGGSTPTEIVVNPGKSTAETEPTVQPNAPQPASEAQQPTESVDTRPAQTDQIEQSIQDEVIKPTLPEQSVINDPTQMPDGTKVETPPVPVAHEQVVVPSEPAPAIPQAGEAQNNGGLPGFSNVPDGGGNQVSQADDMYENGNKIGVMD